MMKRIIAFGITVIMLVATSLGAAADYAGFESERLMEYAEAVAAAAAEYEKSYSFPEEDIVSSDDVGMIMTMVYNENPKLFNLSHSYLFTYGRDSVTDEPEVKSIVFQYSMEKEEYAVALVEVETWAASVKSLGSPDFTELEWALFFHDYLCANYEYDKALQSRSVYSMIKTGKGVCQAYTYAYMLLLESVGIRASWASSNELNHVWNLVELDGEWYHVDVTWDDPVGIITGAAKHTYFLLSDAAISTEEKGHYGWVSSYACTSDKYDSKNMPEGSTLYAYLDGKWYYMYDGDLCATDSVTEKGKLQMELDLCWYSWENPQAYYKGTYSSVISYKDKLFLNTADSILKIDPVKGTKSEVYKYSGDRGRVYGFKINMGEDGVSGAGLAKAELSVNIATEPGDAGMYETAKIAFVMASGSGDANGDGKVNLSDASLMLKFIAKWKVTVDEVAADTDGNSKVTVADVSNVLRYIAAP